MKQGKISISDKTECTSDGIVDLTNFLAKSAVADRIGSIKKIVQLLKNGILNKKFKVIGKTKNWNLKLTYFKNLDLKRDQKEKGDPSFSLFETKHLKSRHITKVIF